MHNNCSLLHVLQMHNVWLSSVMKANLPPPLCDTKIASFSFNITAHLCAVPTASHAGKHCMAIQIKRHQSQSSASPTTPSSHVNFRYLSATQFAIRLKHSQHQCRLASKQISCLQEKISRATVENGIVVDDEMHHWLREIMCAETSEVYRKYKPNSFHHLFWKQQMDAASRQDARGMRWHPAMIRWCLHLRHRSSGAYKELRSKPLLHKVRNPFADDDRPFLFFSDPPHLIKTTRNCWSSKHRNLWVCIFTQLMIMY